jgi:uncharacterized protein (TIGR03437 family)
VDGAVTDGLPYPVLLSHVSVVIDGRDAKVIYAGAAPGMVAGMLLISALLPDALVGYNMQVVLTVGEYSSPNTLSISIQ